MDREQPDQYVHRCQREGGNDCRRGRANTVRLERRRVPDDPGTIRKRDSPHRWYYHHLCFVLSDLETIVKEDLQKVCEYVFLHEKEFTDEYLSGSKKETEKFQSKTKAELKRLSERQEEIGRIIRKLYEDNVCGRITDERFDFLAKSYEDEGNDLKTKIQELKNALASSVQEEEKLSKFLKVVKSYTKIEELTPEILNSFIEKIYIGETEKYDGRKMQEVEIIYKFVGAINLPQYKSH